MYLKVLSEKIFLREKGKLGSKRALKFSKGTWHKKNREREGPSQGIIQKCEPHERSPRGPKFKERSHEETLTQERCAHKAALDLAKIFTSSRMRRTEREFVVDSGASTHVLNRNQVKWRLCKDPGAPTVVLTANWEVHTNKEAQVHVHDLNLFVLVQFLEETRSFFSLGKLCEDHGYSHEWVSGQKPRLTKEVETIVGKTDHFVPLVVPGTSSNSGSNSSSTSTLQDLSSASPAPERSDGLAPGDWCGSPQKPQTNIKKEGWQSKFG